MTAPNLISETPWGRATKRLSDLLYLDEANAKWVHEELLKLYSSAVLETSHDYEMVIQKVREAVFNKQDREAL